MRTWTVKTKQVFLLSVALMVFLSYLFFRVRMATGMPIVHTVWSGELASLLRTIARSVQILGMLAGVSTLVAAARRWREKQPLVYAQVFQAVILCSASFVTPELSAHCIPVLFGVMLDF
jgi:hypothetical protein